MTRFRADYGNYNMCALILQRYLPKKMHVINQLDSTLKGHAALAKSMGKFLHQSH